MLIVDSIMGSLGLMYKRSTYRNEGMSMATKNQNFYASDFYRVGKSAPIIRVSGL
jgi:hypothetical protein